MDTFRDFADRPLFASVEARRNLKVGTRIYVARFDKMCDDFKEKIIEGPIVSTGVRPYFSYKDHTGHTSDWALEPQDIWGLSLEEVELRQQEFRRGVRKVPVVSSPEESLVPSESNAPSDAHPGLVALTQRMALQKVLGRDILNPEKGGIDLSDIPGAAKELASRIGYSIMEFDIQTVDAFVEERFVSEPLYYLLRPGFDQLFDQIQKMLAAAIALKPLMLIDAMVENILRIGTELAEEFLRKNADQIELLQLMTVYSDATARVLCSLFLTNGQVAFAFRKALKPLDAVPGDMVGYGHNPSDSASDLTKRMRELVFLRDKKF